MFTTVFCSQEHRKRETAFAVYRVSVVLLGIRCPVALPRVVGILLPLQGRLGSSQKDTGPTPPQPAIQHVGGTPRQDTVIPEGSQGVFGQRTRGDVLPAFANRNRGGGNHAVAGPQTMPRPLDPVAGLHG